MATLGAGLEQDSSSRHAVGSLGVMDLPSFVLGRNTPTIGIWKSFRNAQDSWEQGRLDGVEPVTGVPRSLLDVFAAVADEPGNGIALRFWSWQDGGGYHAQRQLWDCWRLSGILDVRRRRRQRYPSVDFTPTAQGDNEPKDLAPDTDTILLEVTHLKRRPDWKQTLDEVRRRIEENSPFRLAGIAFKLLDDAWLGESSDFDIEDAAREIGVEIALL
ncbi:hypothetical protein BHE90_005311 [Fusarium euwallaceae]|uniref:Uncharacterized protein n=2 Tax=Fusarium solani species complex TaxID=232080 RepID=A0A3M2RZM1_9HYPO|nr:hypothetical protein CDV36_009629 [Fusarium kuroshium]RTE80177.1 hypothetical protein BHE90_005311 [Fusarium euwallaceae]